MIRGGVKMGGVGRVDGVSRAGSGKDWGGTWRGWRGCRVEHGEGLPVSEKDGT